MHQFSEEIIEQAMQLAECNDEGALRELIDQLTRFEALRISTEARERARFGGIALKDCCACR